MDARGTACPGPLLEAKKAMAGVAVGNVLELWSTDPQTKTDVGAWAGKVGHEFLGSRGRGRLRPGVHPSGQVTAAPKRTWTPTDRTGVIAAPVRMVVDDERDRDARHTGSAGTHARGPEDPRLLDEQHLGPRHRPRWQLAHALPAGVMVISVPCTSGIKPAWILYAVEQGFDGVFVAADGDECAYLSDCSARSSRIVSAAQQLLKEHGHDPQRVRMAAICSVCAEQFTRYVRQFAEGLTGLPDAASSTE